MSLRDKKVGLLWNAKAGWDAGAQQATEVKGLLSSVGAAVQFEPIEHGRDLIAAARRSLADGCTVLVAAGGDGTLNAVASTLIGNPSASLGVVPAGTLNHFARDLGMQLDPITAAHQLLAGHEISVDAGEVNGRIFLNNSVLGVYPVYRAARRAIESHGLGNTAFGRFLAVVGGIARVFWRMPHLRLRFKADGKTIELESPFVLIANNEHELESGRIGKRISINEGRLWIYAMRRCSRWALLRYFVRYVVGRFSRHDAFEEFAAEAVTIERRRRKRIGVGVDGEIVYMRSPLEYRCLPGALRVIAPENSPLA